MGVLLEIHTIITSMILVAVSEMGDKTQLLAFSLAAKFKQPWAVMAGIFTATIFNHALAAYAGEWISHSLRSDILSWILGISFILFGFWTLKPDDLEASEKGHGLGAYFATTVLFFFAEMGDKTQLATVALGAKYQSALPVTMGTTMGMMISDGLAVFVGEKLAEKISMKWIRWIAASLFFLFGVLFIFTEAMQLSEHLI